jgi:serine/threonine protein kinase/TolB-like protein
MARRCAAIIRTPEGEVVITRGARLGPYEIVAPLGAGGMGEVYRARDTRLERFVAIKVLSSRLASAADALERFQREARAVAALNHPNICTIHDVGLGDAEQPPYIAMELLEGETLHQRLRRGPLHVSDIIDVATRLADALDAAHTRGIIHRDIKPSNIVLTDRGPKILDFGLAKATDASVESFAPTQSGESPLTDPGATVGTLAYMSPEQLRGDDLDARSDVFSLGLVLYEMATGRRAFTGVTSAVVSAAILHDEPLPPRAIREDLPSGLDEIILKALEKDRTLRCQSAAELRADLRRLARAAGSAPANARAEGPASHPVRPSTPARTPPPSDVQIAASLVRRRRAALGVIAVILALVAWAVLLRRPVAPASEEASTVAPSEPSIAVLRFTDLSPGKDQQYFADGVALALINQFAAIPGLRVKGQESSFSFVSGLENRAAIRDVLGVDYILSGSVAKAGNTLRVVANVIDARTGFTIWSAPPIDRALDDVFAIQDEIAMSVAEKLEVSLGLGVYGAPGMTRNVQAYEAFLRAAPLTGSLRPEPLQSAVEELQRAIKIDPEFALAYGLLRLAYLQQASIEGVPARAEDLRRAAVRTLDEAQQRTGDSPPVLVSLVDHHARNGNWLEAGALFERAFQNRELRYPNGPPAGRYLLAAGRARDAIAGLHDARDENPLLATRAIFLAEGLAMTGNPTAALAEIDRLVKVVPAQANNVFVKGTALLVALGMDDRKAIQHRLSKFSPTDPGGDLNLTLARLLDDRAAAPAEIRRLAGITANQTSLGYSVLSNWAAYYGAPELSLELLANASRLNADPTAIGPWRPVMRDVWRLPGFKDFVRSRGFVPYWRKYGWSDFCRTTSGDDFECQ